MRHSSVTTLPNHPKHKTYSVNVKDVVDVGGLLVPDNVKDLMRSLHTLDQQSSTPGTVVIFTKESLATKDAADLRVAQILEASQQHVFLLSSAEHDRFTVLDCKKSAHAVLLSKSERATRGKFGVLKFSGRARACSENTLKIYLQPGLLYLSVPTNSARANRLSVVLACAEVQTNRDRIVEWSDGLKEVVGRALYCAMKAEMDKLTPAEKKVVKDANPDLEPLPLLLLTLEAHCPVSFHVVQCLCDDFQRGPTEGLMLVAMAQTRDTEIKLRELKHPVLIEGPPSWGCS
eukprot:gene35664-43975_t